MTVFPTDMANGLPPKLNHEFRCHLYATFLFIKTAPIGNPPPIPFAIGTISGLTFDCSNAKNFHYDLFRIELHLKSIIFFFDYKFF